MSAEKLHKYQQRLNMKTQGQKEQNKSFGMRKGFATMDALIAISLIVVILIIAYFVKSKAGTPSEIRTETMKVQTVLNGVETAKVEYNNGMYVFTTKKSIPTIVKLKLALGGTKGVASLGSWTYECPSGNNSVIKINTNQYPDADIRAGIVESINSKDPYWVATDKGSTVEIVRTNSVCQ